MQPAKSKEMKRLFSLLIFLSLFAQAQEKADLIVYNGKIATMQKSGEFVQAIAIKDGIILATGTSKSILWTLIKPPQLKSLMLKVKQSFRG